jgi:hypothetical protein
MDRLSSIFKLDKAIDYLNAGDTEKEMMNLTALQIL